ncbi:MAG: DUF805 domain-containing protein [Candidatus Eisenbacteria bacterium]|nr:DUF805 domain-containing protein [Candidatus Eisenbacteria bacterium]
MNWYLGVLRKYAVFSGRARRKEYWYFALFNAIVCLVLMLIDRLTHTYSSTFSMGLLSGIYSLAVLIPSLAVAVRRLHDTGRTGWWLLLALVPFLGGLVILVFTVQDSRPGSNQYGANPKELQPAA